MAARRYRGLPDRLLFHVRAILENFHFGIHESVRKGDGMTFAAIRDFQEGEPLKRVDWMRSLERSHDLDELLIREFEPEKQMEVVIMLDAMRGMHVPLRKAEAAVALLWLSALSAFKMRDVVRIFVAFDQAEGGIIASPRCVDEQEVNEFLRAIARGQLQSSIDPGATALDVLGGSLPNDTFVVAISDFEREQKFFAHLADRATPSRHSRLLLAVLDGWEGVAPLPALISVQGESGGRRREIDARPGGELELTKRKISEAQEELLTSAWKRGHIAARIPVFAERPFEELVRKLAIVAT